ncbi:MAG TPA: SURF1 family cytochrome oxidase biogenesis protein, partial [Telluria sp.]|nr:SURF1 family cytochrome oxidase biogenesis protein [Telluria sp.]
VVVDGVYLPNHDTLVQAVTDLGPGYWVMTPLCRSDGSIVIVNRGFTPVAAQRAIDPRLRGDDARPVIPAQAGIDGRLCPTGVAAKVTGLLRLTEPSGAFLRKNDPAANRWYSRDVQAIATARGLTQVAAYFVDADASPRAAPGEPIGGLTVIHFPNNHLQYALTWYAMALMAAGALAWILRTSRRRKPTP